MDQPVADRRQFSRFPPPSSAASRATLRPGCVVSLVDVSAGGALVEAARPLRPGARVHLQVATAARTFAIAAQVLRCMVWSLDPLDGVTYRGALKFEQCIEWSWGGATRGGYETPEFDRPDATALGHPLPAARPLHDDARRKVSK